MKSYVIKNVKEEIKNQYIIRDIAFINEKKKKKMLSKFISQAGLIMVYQIYKMGQYLIFLVKL